MGFLPMACSACFLIQPSPTCSGVTHLYQLAIKKALYPQAHTLMEEAVLVDTRFQSFLSPSVGLVFGVYCLTSPILRLGAPVSL